MSTHLSARSGAVAVLAAVALCAPAVAAVAPDPAAHGVRS